MKVKEHGRFKAQDLVRYPLRGEPNSEFLTSVLHGCKMRLLYYDTVLRCWRSNFSGKQNPEAVDRIGVGNTSDCFFTLLQRRNP